MGQLSNGFCIVHQYAEALSVQEALLSSHQRLGATHASILALQSNLAATYHALRRFEEALRMRRDVYSGRLKLSGEEHRYTILAANNYSASLVGLQRFEEAKSLLHKTMPVARRALGESDDLTLRMRWNYAEALYENPASTLDDLREAVTTVEDGARTARRVFGGAHPLTLDIERELRNARAALRAGETPPPGSA